MKKKVLGMVFAGFIGSISLAGCISSETGVSKDTVLKPGVYTGQSSESDDEDGGGYAVVELTIGENNKIEDCKFETFEKNGTSKHTPDYGKINGQISNQDYYNKAQNAVEAAEGYAKQYLEAGNLADVDAVSGATISYNQFTEAVNIALEKAAQ